MAAVDSGFMRAGPDEWWEDHDNRIRVARRMIREGWNGHDLLYFMEHPWKFTEIWERIQQPEPTAEELGLDNPEDWALDDGFDELPTDLKLIDNDPR